ncbi:MAG: T9SS type A sorting domain-containing protein [Fluviicola sp.]
MKRTINYLSLVVMMCFVGQANAYDHDFGKRGKKAGKPKPTVTTKAATCAPANYRKTMDFNDVSCQLETGGLLFMDRANGLATYTVPKKKGNETVVTTIYAGALWMGGVDTNGLLKIAAVKFREGNDFWPGPLKVIDNTGNFDPSVPQGDNTTRDHNLGTIDAEECLFYDNIFTVSKAGVVQFVIWSECTTGDCPAPSNEIMAQINAWPGNGKPGYSQDQFLAPFYDKDDDTFYEPEEGDYPWYDDILGRDDIQCGADRRVTLFGDITHWWVFNDQGNIHTESQGDPIGMEIHAQAFAFATDDEINKMTFYNYELINRGTQTLYNTYFSQYVDADLGNYNDDYAGCDVTRGLSYMYNGDLNDEPNSGRPGFGVNPPAIGVDFFEGPYQDADGSDNPGPVFDSITKQWDVPTVADAIANKGIVYRGLGIGYGDDIVDNERYGMRNFTIYTGGGAEPQADPTSASQFYNYMRGLWRFGDQLYYGGTGFPGLPCVTGIPTNYMFPADSDSLDWGTEGNDPGFDWSEFEPCGAGSASNPSGDRRFVQSAGPFTLRPGAVNNITVGIVYARSFEGQIFSSVNSLKTADTKAQALFDNCFRILEPPAAPVVTIQEMGNELIIMLDNPKGSNNYREEYIEEDKIDIVDPNGAGDTLPNGDPIIYDKNYRFEGYQIYQLKNAQVGVTDLDDETVARLVAQCDIKNGVKRLINFETDEEMAGYSFPVEKVKGSDQGIKHTFRVTEDQFAQGDRKLVNFKTYYYIAVAYGYNSYKPYDPGDPQFLDGQKKPYLRSRINADGSTLQGIPAIPHHVGPELGGSQANSVYGQTPRITRLDGTGNGGRQLQLTAASENSIVANGFLDELEYDYNGGPINVKVIDPLNVVGGYFECKFHDYNGLSGNGIAPGEYKGIDTASWTVYHYDAKGGNLIDEITSTTTINQRNEQVIMVPRWGVSIEIVQEKYYFPAAVASSVHLYADPLSSSISYKDSTKQWLDFVKDDGSYTPRNWIRSGNNNPQPVECNPALGNGNPCLYPDEIGKDPKEQYNKLLGGGIGPHKLTGYQGAFMPLAYPADLGSVTLTRLNSSIKYLPSVDIVITSDPSKWTRCAVIEMGRDPALNQNGGEPGELRAAPSLNKDWQPDGTGTGMSWFPGYAIDLETGARLHMAFGENSFLGGDKGADMRWNPSDRQVDENGLTVFGGNQPIWVFGVDVNGEGCPYYDGVNNWVYDQFQIGTSSSYKKAFTSLMWIVNPVTATGHDFMETDVRLKVRVNKQYADFMATGDNGGRPMYGWSMDDLQTTTASRDVLASALDLINVVPNPYYAFSEYERNRIDTRVKIVNLPDQCTVTIYNVSGKMIRQYKKDNEITFIDWDLKNTIGVPIASGVYLIHVEVPGIGERIVKFFGGMRQVDLETI